MYTPILDLSTLKMKINQFKSLPLGVQLYYREYAKPKL